MRAALLAALAPLLMAPAASHYSAAQRTDPAACGAACANDLSAFPYHGHLMQGGGTDIGALGDGTYLYLGTIGSYGYVTTSNHSGCIATTCSYRFAFGAHAGKWYRSTGRDLGWNDLLHDPPSPDTDAPHVFELEAMQYAPGCTAAGAPTGCCTAYRQGNACAGSPACDGGGCVTSALPTDLATVAMVRSEAVTAGASVLVYGLGDTAGSASEWYLECNSDDARGGLPGAPHGCCSGGVEFTASSKIGDVQSGEHPAGTLDASDFTFGGTGHNCDTFGGGPGYTYLGAVAESTSAPTWTRVLFDAGGITDATHFDTSDVAACRAAYPTGVAATQIAGLTAPSARASNHADCGARSGHGGDSGGPVFALVGGAWKLLGPNDSGDALAALGWWLWPAIRNLTPGAGVGGSQ